MKWQKKKKKKKNEKHTHTHTHTHKQNLWFEHTTPFQNVIDLLSWVSTATAFPLEQMLFMLKNKSLTVKKTLLYWSPLNWYDPY